METVGFASVIGAVNTPLALAALSLLVFGSILYISVKSSSRERPQLIRYGFGISAMFGVLAIGGFMFDAYANQIFLVRGSITDEGQGKIGGAVIDLVGLGRSASLPDGSFEIPVARSQVRDRYRIEVRKTGFENQAKDIVGPYPDFVTITAKPLAFSADKIHLNEDGVASIYIGVPEFTLGLFGTNETERTITMRSASLRLKAPSGRLVVLYPGLVLDQSNMQRPFSGFTFPPQQDAAFRVVWNDGSSVGNAIQLASDNGIFAAPLGCLSTNTGNALAPPVSDFFDKTFVWEPGEWSARMTVATDTKSYAKSFGFALSQEDVAALKGLKQSYLQCRGLVYGSHYVSDGLARSFVPVVVSEDEP